MGGSFLQGGEEKEWIQVGACAYVVWTTTLAKGRGEHDVM